MRRFYGFASQCLTILLVWTGPSASAVDFIRGDVNGDGRVTISDGYRILLWQFNGYDPPQCMDAADVNDNGVVGSEDIVHLLAATIQGSRTIPLPFPEAGSDLTDDLDPDVDCQAYGGGEAREDSTYQLQVLDSSAPGGDESTAFVRIALTNPTPIAAVSGQIRLLSPIVQGVGGVDGPIGWTIQDSTVSGEDLVLFGVISRLSSDAVPPAQSAQVVRNLFVCLRPGTPAGEYPVVLESAELADVATGQAIVPFLLPGGTLVVEETVTGVNSGPWTPCDRPRPEPPPSPETVDAMYALGSGSAARGTPVTVPFTVRADEPIEGYSFSIDFDESALSLESAELVWETPDGSAYAFSRLRLDNRDDQPGSAGVDEGYITGSVVFAWDAHNTMPAGTDNLALRLQFEAKPEAPLGTTRVRFLNGGRGASGQPTSNLLTTHGFSVTPGSASSFVFVEGRISIVPDVTVFIRGDANGDGVLDISDPMRTLGYVFLGGRRPYCYDAADANDDGQIDVSDPVAMLQYLFLDGRPLLAPSGAPGEDPTFDGMTCSRR